MRAPVAVHLDIRPRLTFPAEPRVQARRRWRLPPLAVPALGYWLAMGALTYGFTRLGPHPLDDVQAAALPAPAIPPNPESPPDVEAAPPSETPPTNAPPAVAPAPEAEPEPEPEARPPEMAPLVASSSDRERRDDSPARRQVPASSDERAEAPRANTETPTARLTFPEFTDSSPAPKREHAADGPRIASLFDAVPEQPQERPGPSPKPDAPTPPVNDPDAPAVLTSCEAAIARNNELLTIGGPRAAPDITREAYASILQNGRYLQACSIPERTVFEICAAVKDGHAVGITVVSNPASPALNGCVRKAVARLKFPQNSRLDVTHTRFDAVSR